VPLPRIQPLALGRRVSAFADPAWLYELKWDGFRSLAYVERGRSELWSRNDHKFSQFTPLNVSIASLSVNDAILDGEIVCLDQHGKADFNTLLFHRGDPYFYAFDLLWLNGHDLRLRTLVERKHLLREMLQGCDPYVRYVEHFDAAQGPAFFALCCQHDLEGVIAKRRDSTYTEADHKTAWLKIKNRNYSQAEGRGEIMNRKPAARAAAASPQFKCGGY
jgi:bifunctional non-homologous end joining protein LigD